MCGIVGYARAGGDETLLERMNATLHHRGPDDRGLYRSPEFGVGLAQCRLAILDLTPAGHQPMRDAAGEVWITFNGEIYNVLELRRELESYGHTFRSRSDTEVIIEGYRRWGDEVLTRLNGMFALALYDVRARRVLLARDRAGEKPLFYRIHNGALAFASELKALMADESVPRRVDARALDHYLAYGYVPSDLCILEGVQKLRQAEALSFDLDRGEVARRWFYWQLPEPPAAAADEEESVAELERLLENSVRRQLVADVPVGVLLSGGVDSSLITAMASRAASRVKTFTVSFPGHGRNDEGPYARLVADHFGTDHHELAAEPANVELLPLLARQYDEPIGDSAALPTYLLTQMVVREVKVALGGEGGDELFGGYPHYSWLLVQDRLRRVVPSPLRRAGSLAAAMLPVGTRGRNHLVGLGRDPGASIAQVNLLFDRATRRRLLRVQAEGCAPEERRTSLSDPRHSTLRRAMETDFRTTLVDGYLVKVDRASMLNSLELRAPFLDHRIIEFAFGRVPDSSKATTRDRKILLRRLGAKVLPPALDLKRKQGFTMPLDRWFHGQWGDFVERVLLDGRTFDKNVVRALIRGQRRGLNNTTRLHALVMFELWRNEYRVTM